LLPSPRRLPCAPTFESTWARLPRLFETWLV
jgi:hypothetical protein